MHFGDAQSFTGFASATAEGNGGSAGGVIADFDILPADSSGPASSHGFQHGLFCGPSAGVVLSGGLARAAILDLVRRENAIEKQFGVPVDHLSDSQAFDDVGSDADDLHSSPAGQIVIPHAASARARTSDAFFRARAAPSARMARSCSGSAAKAARRSRVGEK
jgi:hypothetical protein